MTAPARQLSLFKGKRQRGVKPKQPIEFQTHCAIADTLKIGLAPGWMYTHVPAGEARPAFINAKGKRVSPAAERLKRMGLMPGWPDFILLDPNGRLHCLELKRGKAPLTGDQAAFQIACRERGVPYEVARSFDEAIRVLTLWGAIRVRLGA